MNWLFWSHFKSSGLFRPRDCFERKSWHSSGTDWSFSSLLGKHESEVEMSRNVIETQWILMSDRDEIIRTTGTEMSPSIFWKTLLNAKDAQGKPTVRRAVPFHGLICVLFCIPVQLQNVNFQFYQIQNKTQEQSTSRRERLTDASKAAGLSYLRNGARLGYSSRYAEEFYGLVQGERRKDQWSLDIARVDYTWSSGERSLCGRGYQVVRCLYIWYSSLIFSTNMRLILAYIFPRPLGPLKSTILTIKIGRRLSSIVGSS